MRTRGYVGWYVDVIYAAPSPNAARHTELVIVQFERSVARFPVPEAPQTCPRIPTEWARAGGASAGYHGAGQMQNPYRYGNNSFCTIGPHIPESMWAECAEAWDAGWIEGRASAS